jgi:hypothetical protein
VSAPRGYMPVMNKIIDYWRTDPVSDTPALKSYWIGFGEPFCFGCGWLPPVQYGRKNSWRVAAKWLDRAHLKDHCNGGENEPPNLVPLCHLCHHGMPSFESRDAALQWVCDYPPQDWRLQIWTDFLYQGFTPTRNTMIRVKLDCLRFIESAGLTEQTPRNNGDYLRAVALIGSRAAKAELAELQDERNALRAQTDDVNPRDLLEHVYRIRALDKQIEKLEGPKEVDAEAELATLRARLADVLRRERDGIDQDRADGHMDRARWRTMNERINGRLGEIEAQIAAAGSTSPLAIVAAEDIAGTWAGLSVAQRRNIIGALMTPVLHPPGRGTKIFRPETVEVRWNGQL